jgi:uncharacterized membrane protein
MSGWKYVKTIAWLLAVFVAGLVVGGVVTVRVIQHQYRQRMNAATWTPRTMTWLDATLGLSAEQQSKIRPVVERSMKKMAGMRSRVEADRKQLFGEMFVELSDHLTDEQRQQLHRAIQEAVAKGSPYSSGENNTGEP